MYVTQENGSNHYKSRGITMTESSSDETIKVWTPIVWLCRWIWKKYKILISIDILSVIVSGLPLLDRTTIPNLLGIHILAWILPHWLLFAVLSGPLISLTIICGLVERLAAPLSYR